MKMADVIHSNYLLIPVINRLGIHLGFGDKSVKNICNETGIDIDFFLTVINTFSNENYFPEKQLRAFNLLTFLKYLKKTHSYYLSTQVPIVDDLIDRLIVNNKSKTNLHLVKNFFDVYKLELFEHINREERITFPYIETLYKLYHENFDVQTYKKATRDYSIKRFISEHSNINDKLSDLQNLLIKYIPDINDEVLTNSIVFELFRLEKDIVDHTRLEEKILKPMVFELETSLKNLNN